MFFILFREPLLNEKYFFVMHVFLIHIYILSFEWMNFIYEKKNCFQIIFLICAALYDPFPPFI